jgi:hypothetical protein
MNVEISDFRMQWEKQLKQEQLQAARKEGRELARRADKSHSNGRIEGICNVADFFIGKERPDIAKALLSNFMIDREKAAASLEADKRTRSITLASLDKADIWPHIPSLQDVINRGIV